MKENKVAILGSLFLVVVFFLGCGYTKRELVQMDHSGVQLTVSFPDWGGNNSKPEIVLTFVNPMAQSRQVILPCPMPCPKDEDLTWSVSNDRPTLVLCARKAPSSEEDEQGFMLAEFGSGTNSQPKVLTLKPGESAQMSYKLASIYHFWHAGPIESERFIDFLKPGENEVFIRAIIIAYSMEGPVKGDRLESPSVVLKCEFPQWMFKRDVEKGVPSSDTGENAQK